jgi:hypothetical protein
MDLSHRLDRRLYQGNRPSRMARLTNGAWGRLAARGWTPSRLVRMDVTGRRTGRTISFPVVVADFEGDRYLVSMLGDNTNWVRNVRAADGRVVLRHGAPETVRLVEVAPGERAPILRRYLECAPGARPHIPVDRRAPATEFERVADRYPVFRITQLG